MTTVQISTKSMKRILTIIAVAVFALTSCKPSYVFDLDQRLGLCGGVGKDSLIAANGLAYAEASVTGFLIPEKSEEEFAAKKEYAAGCVVPIKTANGFYPGEIILVGPDADLDRAIKYANVAIRRAAEVGIETLVLGSGKARSLPEGWTLEQAEEQFVTLLKGMAPACEKYCVRIAIEPLQRSECNFINTVREGAELARRSGSDNICVLADIFHMTRVGEGPDGIVDSADKLIHCHIAENEDRTAPGVKGDDFTPYLRALKQIKYTGRISFECRWGNIGEQLPLSVEVMKQQIAQVRNEK